MEKLLKTVTLMILGIGFMTVVSACSGDDNQDSSNDSANTTDDSKPEQELNFIKTSNITTMDSSMATDEISFQNLGETMEGLYRGDENTEMAEGIAIDHEISDDGLEWTFNLRDDAVWSNGDTVTANDFVYAWRRAVDPDTGSEYGPFMMKGHVKNAEEISNGDKDVDELGVTAEDDYTLVVELPKPVPYFESLMTFGTFLPLNEEFVEDQGEDYAQNSDNILYNGPFKLEDWESTSDSWNLVKNDDYWDTDTVKLERMTYSVVKDLQTGVDLFESGDVDRAELNSDLVDQYSTHDDYTNRSKPAVYFLKLNQTRNEALENKNIRAAISRAFDKEALTDEILNDGSITANYLVPEGMGPLPEGMDEDGEQFRDVNGDLVEYDLDKAQEYWKKGLDELDEDSIELELLGEDTENLKTINEYLANQLQSNLEGLEVTLKQVPAEQKRDLDAKKDYDIQFSAWGPDYLDPYSYFSIFVTDGENNNMGYSNDEYDELLAEARDELTEPGKEGERYENLLEAEKILFDDAVIAPLYQEYASLLQDQKIKGVITTPLGPTYEFKWAEVVDEN